jgi:Uma2 family endonuclease
MAAVPTLPLVSVDDYLSSTYHPEKEYVDGVLVERSVPTIAHSLLQMILIRYFSEYEDSLDFLSLPEVRTRIIERARYRVPDVILCPVPLPTGKVVTSIPWVVFEILSPDDRMPEQLERLRDYDRIGVDHVVLLDPERLIGYRFERGSLFQTQFTSLDLSSGSVPFDSDALFRRLVEKQNKLASKI